MLTHLNSNCAKMRQSRHGKPKSCVIVLAIFGCGLLLSGCTMPAPERIVYLKSGEVAVEKGDSLSSIAARYGVSPKALAACNHLEHQQSLQGVKTLMLPNSPDATVPVHVNSSQLEGGPVLLSGNDSDIWSDEPDPESAYDRSAPPAAGWGARKSIQNEDVDLDGLEDVVMGSNSQKPSGEKPIVETVNDGSNEDNADSKSSDGSLSSPRQSTNKTVRFRRPTPGKISVSFHRNQRGAPAQGIKFKAPLGTPVRAVADGRVVLSGKMQGDSSKVVVLIRHNDGWTSCYKALADAAVAKNKLVKQGDCLGTCQGPELIFELRNPERIAVDPQKYLAL